MSHDLMIIFTVSIVTIILRALPFIVFKDKSYPIIDFLGHVLPYCIMAMLVVYCLKDVNILTGSHGIPEAIGVITVVILHLYKKNTLISIFGGTIIYMICVQLIF